MNYVWHAGNLRSCNLLWQEMNDIVDAENEFARASALLQNAIDAATNFQVMRIGHQTLVHNNRSQRTEWVHRFSDEKLASVALLLPISCWNILGNAVAKHMIECIFLFHMSRLFANDYGQFDFPIELLRREKNGKIFSMNISKLRCRASVLTFVIECKMTSPVGPVKALANLLKNIGSFGGSLFCSWQCPK